MLTGTFVGTMIMSACVVLTFILLQPYFYWRYMFDKSRFWKMFYVLGVNGLAGLLAVLFSYHAGHGVYIDNLKQRKDLMDNFVSAGSFLRGL